MSDLPGLIDEIQGAASLIKESTDRRTALLTHFDGDGLSAGGAFLRSMTKLGVPSTYRVTPEISTEAITRFLQISAELYVFCDMGTAHRETISAETREDSRVLIVDHHQTEGEKPDGDDVAIVNPEYHGFDGGREGSAGVLSSLIGFHALDGRDAQVLKPGVVGMVSDIQSGESGGVNERLVQLALDSAVVERERVFPFLRMKRRPLHQAIAWTYEPYIPGLSGKEEEAVSLLSSLDIPLKDDGTWNTPQDLGEEEREKITQAIIQRALSGGEALSSESFTTEVYEFPDEEQYFLSLADEFSSALSACGRMNRGGLGIRLAAGARDSVVSQVEAVIEEKRRALSEQLDALRDEEREEDSVLLLDGRQLVEENFTGVISTIYSHSPDYEGKVVLLFADGSGGKVKVSARAPRELTDLGLNLGEILGEVASSMGGEGGGHVMAAGARIPVDEGQDVVRSFSEQVKERVSSYST